MARTSWKTKIIISLLIILIAFVFIWLWQNYGTKQAPAPLQQKTELTEKGEAWQSLDQLLVRDTDPGKDYDRKMFSRSWGKWGKCNTRQRILQRDLKNIKIAPNGCTVLSGQLIDPYSGKTIDLPTAKAVAKNVQIDHIVALANAWVTGAKYLSYEERRQLFNDDLELIAVSSRTNQAKGASDAAEWLPDNQRFHCLYIARQIAIKIKYRLWVTAKEKSAMMRVLQTCPSEPLPAQ